MLGAMKAHELWAYPNHDLSELVAGSRVVREPPGGTHGRIGVMLAYRLHRFVTAKRLGVVLVETGFMLQRDPDTVLGPDVSVVSNSRLGAGAIPAGFIEGAPDLAIEIVSPFDRIGTKAEKIRDYLDAGTTVVWVVDPAGPAIMVHTASGQVRRLGLDDDLEAEGVLPGFSCRVREVLADVVSDIPGE